MTLAWNVVTMAARLCRNAGYHRREKEDPSLTDYERRGRKWVFWMIYTFDHALSLNLGQACNMPDFDLTVSMPASLDVADPLGTQLWIWVRISHVQGKVYEQLYSANAQKEDLTIRSRRAQDLASELSQLQTSFKVSSPPEPGFVTDRTQPIHVEQFPDQYQQAAMRTVQFMFYSTLTLIYKVLPSESTSTPKPLKFIEKCTEAARTTLISLNEAWGDLKDEYEDYLMIFINW